MWQTVVVPPPTGEAKRMVRKHCAAWQFYSSFAPLVSIKLLFLRWTHAPWYCRPQTDFCPIPTAFCLNLLQQSRKARIMVRNSWAFSIFHIFNSPFFNKYSIFEANTWSVILQPTGWLLPHRHCRLACLLNQSDDPENGEKQWSIHNFTVC